MKLLLPFSQIYRKFLEHLEDLKDSRLINKAKKEPEIQLSDYLNSRSIVSDFSKKI